MRRLAVEFTRSSVRVLLMEGSVSKPKILALRVEPIRDEPNAQVLQRLLSGVRPARAQVRCAVAREQVITRLLKFPTTKPEELAKMVALTGKVQVPYPPEQVVCDFQVLEQQAGVTTVQFVACHQDLVERHLKLLQQLHLEPSDVVPSSWGMLAWYRRFGKTPQIREPVMVLNVDADHTHLALIHRGGVVLSRSLEAGLRDWQAGSETLTALAQEVERSLSGLRKEWPGLEVQTVLLTGMGALEEWTPILELRLGKPVVVARASMPAAVNQMEGSPVVLLGLATAEPSWLVNLLPQATRRGYTQHRRLREVTLMAVLLAMALGLGTSLLWTALHRQERLAARGGKTLQQLQATTQQLERQERLTRVIDQVQTARRWVASMLAELFRLTPPEVLFESLQFERSRGELLVRGSAPSTRHVLDYIQQLEQSTRWTRVELRYSAQHRGSAGTRTDFELLLQQRERV